MEKNSVKIVQSLVTVLFKETLYLCTYFVFTKKTIVLSLSKIEIKLHYEYLNYFDMVFKKYVIRLHNLISMNIFFTER